MAQPLVHLPPWVAENVAKEQMVDDTLSFAKGYSKMLRQLDDRLSLVFVKENASAPGLEPGRWHIRRTNDGTLDSYIPITTPDGGYREPNAADLDRLRERDAWVTPVRDILARRHERELRAERDKALWREQAKDEFATDFSAAKRVAGDGGLEKRLWGKGRS